MEENKSGEKKPSLLLRSYDWLESLVSAVVVCILLFLFAVRVVSVDGSSMKPTLHDGEKVVITRIFSAPKQGDIVVLTQRSYGNDSLVKRVVATEGQTVEIDERKGVVTVDGVELNEPYIAEPTYKKLDMTGPVTVREGCIFCMGDNRNESTDSRSSRIGQIDTRSVLGKVLFRIWPLSFLGNTEKNG